MALAIRFDRLLREGTICGQTDLARLAKVTQPRVTQIMNLLHLAPDIQEDLLFLPRVESGDDPIHEKMLRPIQVGLSRCVPGLQVPDTRTAEPADAVVRDCCGPIR